MTTQALINRTLIRWARDRSGLTAAQVAGKIGVREGKFNAWEQGEDYPTLRQAQVLANKLYVPFGYLYLSSPPEESLPLPDLRTFEETGIDRPSPNFLDLLYDVLRKHAWYRQELIEQNGPTLGFVGRFGNEPDVNVVARDIIETVGLTESLREHATTWDGYLRTLVLKAEDVGIVVMRNGVVQNNTHRRLNVDEFRGFAISDPIAPLVFVNTRDAKAAQIFTFAHELAHLWLGATGVTNLDYRRKSSEQPLTVERISDMVAAEVLMPERVFQNRWDIRRPIEGKLGELAKYFRVSSVAILRRAFELTKMDRQTFWALYDVETAKQTVVKGTGGDYYSNVVSRSSMTLTKTLLTAVGENTISRRDAANLLGVAIQNLDKVAVKVFGGTSL